MAPFQANWQSGSIQLTDVSSNQNLASNKPLVVEERLKACIQGRSGVPAPNTTQVIQQNTTVQSGPLTGYQIDVKITLTAGPITWDWQNGQGSSNGGNCNTALYTRVSGEAGVGSAAHGGKVSITASQTLTATTEARVLIPGSGQPAGSFGPVAPCGSSCSFNVSPAPNQWHIVEQFESVGVSG